MTSLTLDHADGGDEPLEDLADGATWLLDVVAAVDYLRRGHRPGLTVWDALAEALTPPTDPENFSAGADPSGERAFRVAVLIQRDVDASTVAQAAVRRWVTTMADRYNRGHHWPHPATRRRFPPPTLTFS